MVNIQQIKAQVTPKLRGTTLDRIPAFYEKCQEAASNVLSQVSPHETIRAVRIENAIYSQVYSYAIPQDIREDGVIDIRPIAGRSITDDVAGRLGKEFDIRKDSDTFAIEIINGIKTLRLSKAINGHKYIASLDTLQNITVSGDVVDLTTNSLDKISNGASVQFGLSGGGGRGTVRYTSPNYFDFNDLKDVGSIFHWLNFSDASRLNHIEIVLATDPSNYITITVNHPHDRATFESNAWTLQRGDLVNGVVVGNPDYSQIKYIEITFDYSIGLPLANIRLDTITAAKGKPYELVYYSNCLFKGVNGGYKTIPTDDSDMILLPVEKGGINLFLYELMLILIQELGSRSVLQSASFFFKKLEGDAKTQGLYERFIEEYPAQSLPRHETYYDFGLFNNDNVY